MTIMEYLVSAASSRSPNLAVFELRSDGFKTEKYAPTHDAAIYFILDEFPGRGPTGFKHKLKEKLTDAAVVLASGSFSPIEVEQAARIAGANDKTVIVTTTTKRHVEWLDYIERTTRRKIALDTQRRGER